MTATPPQELLNRCSEPEARAVLQDWYATQGWAFRLCLRWSEMRDDDSYDDYGGDGGGGDGYGGYGGGGGGGYGYGYGGDGYGGGGYGYGGYGGGGGGGYGYGYGGDGYGGGGYGYGGGGDGYGYGYGGGGYDDDSYDDDDSDGGGGDGYGGYGGYGGGGYDGGGDDGGGGGGGGYLLKEALLEPGLTIICSPSGGDWPFVRVGWLRRKCGDEWEIVNARIIRRFGHGPEKPAELARIAQDGPWRDGAGRQRATQLLAASAKPEPIHRLHVCRSIACNPDAWAEDCPRPADWSAT